MAAFIFWLKYHLGNLPVILPHFFFLCFCFVFLSDLSKKIRVNPYTRENHWSKECVLLSRHRNVYFPFRFVTYIMSHSTTNILHKDGLVQITLLPRKNVYSNFMQTFV